jgi:hypothetical protein
LHKFLRETLTIAFFQGYCRHGAVLYRVGVIRPLIGSLLTLLCSLPFSGVRGVVESADGRGIYVLRFLPPTIGGHGNFSIFDFLIYACNNCFV